MSKLVPIEIGDSLQEIETANIPDHVKDELVDKIYSRQILPSRFLEMITNIVARLFDGSDQVWVMDRVASCGVLINAAPRPSYSVLAFAEILNKRKAGIEAKMITDIELSLSYRSQLTNVINQSVLIGCSKEILKSSWSNLIRNLSSKFATDPDTKLNFECSISNSLYKYAGTLLGKEIKNMWPKKIAIDEKTDMTTIANSATRMSIELVHTFANSPGIYRATLSNREIDNTIKAVKNAFSAILLDAFNLSWVGSGIDREKLLMNKVIKLIDNGMSILEVNELGISVIDNKNWLACEKRAVIRLLLDGLCVLDTERERIGHEASPETALPRIDATDETLDEVFSPKFKSECRERDDHVNFYKSICPGYIK